MNRIQWLHVWGLRPVAVPDRRKQPSWATRGMFMRRLSDRPNISAGGKESTTDFLAD
jgi:hypothetical protein